MPSPSMLEDLHPYEYEHPFDERALNALQNTPGLDTVVRQYNKHAVERLVTVQYTGSNLKITPKNYPKIYELLDTACKTINLPKYPELYLEWSYNVNGFTIGVDNPIIVLTSGSIDLLDDDELLYLIGHEVGHIKSRHTLYHQMGQFLPVLGDILGQVTLGVGKLISSPLQLALMHWSRMSEFTADRAGLLACQNSKVAIQVMMKWAGMPVKHYESMHFDTFVAQAKDFEDLDYDSLNKAVKFFTILNSTHPWTVLRAAELIKWIKSGDYQKVLTRETKDRLYKLYMGNNVFCRHCDSKIEDTDKFCPSCGHQLATSQQGIKSIDN